MTEYLMARKDELDAHIADTDDPHGTTAGQVTVTPTGDIAATNVQDAIAELDSEKQPLDALLTALAALTTAANQLIYSTGSDTVSMTSLTAYARTLLDDADATTARATLGAEATGTAAAAVTAHEGAPDPHPGYLTAAEGNAAYQSLDTELTALAGLTSAADKGVQFTGAGTAATFDLTTAGKALLDDADAEAQRTTLGLGTAATATLGTDPGQVPTNADLPAAVGAATQAEQEAGSSTTVYTSPGRQHFHPSAAKAWVLFNGTGTVSITSSYNVSSVTDNGTGNYTINFSTAFSNANYAAAAVVRDASNLDRFVGGLSTETRTTTAYQIRTMDSGASLRDVSEASLVFFGD